MQTTHKENDYTAVQVNVVLKQPKRIYFSVENKHNWEENNCTLPEEENDWHTAPKIVESLLSDNCIKFYTEDGTEIPRELIDHISVDSDDSYSSTEERLLEISKEYIGNYIVNKNGKLLNS